ncbi:MAG: DUF4174 domain-containing protein [Gemmobacter sp.]|uniref:DUF4174 domain-containing protein n=1 Tax=Gemmobacter sp. TaxID=1898957 RepID=UPI00391BC35E
MKPLHVLFAALLPLAAQAADAPPVLAPVAAAEIGFDAQLYVARPVVVFADSAADPNFHRQLELLARDPAALAERDVVVVTDTDPAARSEWRQKLRPRGFSLVILDKDLKPVTRKPLPWDVREIVAAIDKLPSRRQEILERNPGRVQ